MPYDELEKTFTGHIAELLSLPNVVGVAPGRKHRGGVAQDSLALVVLVTKKVPLEELPPGAVVPKVIDGIETDVLEIGDLRAVTGYEDQNPSPVPLATASDTAG